ncbi:AraC family transcriptional regulator ligand-binding domain-containing protein [Microbacterium hominis]|uniref:AraC family transcriptional regulator n=1 Tax=Microbacterium hominis TaxID=162426 RepID=UPI003F683F0D
MPETFALTPSSAVITPNILRYLLQVADEHGVSLDRALRAASLTRAAIESPALRVSYRQGRVIIEQALTMLPVPALGLEVGGRQPITASGLLGLAMMSSATLREAVMVGLRFQNLAGSMVRWSSTEEASALVVTAALQEPSSAVGRFLVDEGFATITRMARDVAGGVGPRLVELSHAAGADSSVYREHFGSAVRFSSTRNAWHIPLAAAHARLPSADAWTHRDTVTMLEAQTESLVERQELVAVLAAQIEEALPEVLPLAVHARALATSERTLRRRLIEVGASYSGVLDDVRKRLTAELFASPQLTTAEIAFRLGYQEDRSLRRSTQRWFGSSPAALHAEARRPSPAR